MYGGLVRRGDTWLNVNTKRPSQWTNWNSSVRPDPYSDCAILNTLTGKYHLTD